MTSIAGFISGSGLEGFEDTPAVTDLPDDVRDDELAEVSRDVDLTVQALNDQQQRVATLTDVRAYGESIRATLTPAEITELQRRVVAVVGEERGLTIVGSVEHYGGSTGQYVLDAGLESVGAMLRAALEALIKLIRTGAKVMMRFFSSAKVVLGRQLKALVDLKNSVNNKLEGWEEFQISIGGGTGVKVNHGPSGTIFDPQADEPLTPYAADDGKRLTPDALYRVHASLLSVTSANGTLRIPSPFVPVLKETVSELQGVVLKSAEGFCELYDDVMGAVKAAAKASDANVDAIFNSLVLEKYVPLSKMKIGRDSNEFQTRVYSKSMLGDVDFNFYGPPCVVFAAAGRNTNDVLKSANSYASMGMSLGCRNPERTELDGSVLSLNKKDSLAAIASVEDLVDSIISSKLDKASGELAKQADEIASRVLPSLDTGKASDDYRGAIARAMSNLTGITGALPRDLISYANQLTNAVKHYVEVSAAL